MPASITRCVDGPSPFCQGRRGPQASRSSLRDGRDLCAPCSAYNSPKAYLSCGLFCRGNSFCTSRSLLFRYSIQACIRSSNIFSLVLPRRHCLNILNSVAQAVSFLDDLDQCFCVCRSAVPNQSQNTFVGVQFILDGLLLCDTWSGDAIVAHGSFCGAAFAGGSTAIALL
jgi:hypothetical protein